MRSSLPLAAETAVPLYARIASILRSQIAEGTLPAGEPLPSIQDLCERYDVARVTVRQAIELLSREGLIKSQRGKVASVAGHRETPATDRFHRSIEVLSENGPDHRIDILSRDTVDDLPPAAKFFGTPQGPYVRWRKVHSEAGAPYAVMTIYVQKALAKTFPPKAETREKTALLVVRHAQIAGARERITVAAADADDAALLDYPVAAPVARLRRVLTDKHGVAVYYGNVVYRGDRFGIEREHDVMVRHNFDGGRGSKRGASRRSSP
jgi:GntR family transcriptional regulator